MADEHSIADPGPLGLAGFAMTTFCLSVTNAGLWKGAGITAALSLALFYGGFAQLVAGVLEFFRKNTFGALAFTSYGAFWLSLYGIEKGWGIVAPTTDSVAIFLLAWTIFTAYMTIAASKTSKAVFTVFLLLTVTFVLLTIGNWGAGHAGIVKAGGWFGIATAIAAWYASAAGVINSTHGKTVLPVG
jgi:hypothetical protein